MSWLNKYRRIAKPNTTTRRLTSLRVFGRYAGIQNFLKDYNAPTPARQMPHPLPEGIEGVRRLIAACDNDRKRALIALCGLVSLRVSEALQVEPEDFDFTNMTLLVRGKGDKQRWVAISPEAWKVLEEPVLRAFAFREPIIGWKDRFARKVISDLGRKANLRRPISSHDLRATCLTAMYAKSKDIRATQEQGGHASVVTTQIYTLISVKDMHEAVSGL